MVVKTYRDIGCAYCLRGAKAAYSKRPFSEVPVPPPPQGRGGTTDAADAALPMFELRRSLVEGQSGAIKRGRAVSAGLLRDLLPCGRSSGQTSAQPPRACGATTWRRERLDLEGVGGRGAIHRSVRAPDDLQNLADLSRILDGGDQAQAPAAARAGEDIDGQWRGVDLAVGPGGHPSSGLGAGTVAEDRA